MSELFEFGVVALPVLQDLVHVVLYSGDPIRVWPSVDLLRVFAGNGFGQNETAQGQGIGRVGQVVAGTTDLAGRI